MFNENFSDVAGITTDDTITSATADATTAVTTIVSPPRRLGPPRVGEVVTAKFLHPLYGKGKGDKAPYGAIFTFGSEKARVMIGDLVGSDAETLARLTSFAAGDEIEAMITRTDLKSYPARFDLSERLATAFAHARNLLGEQVTGRVIEVTRFGAFLDVGQGVYGVIFTNEMSAADQRKRHSDLKIGDSMTVTVIGVESDDRNPFKLNVTFSEIDAALQKAAGLAGSVVTAQVLGPCNSGTRLLLNGGVEAVLPPENLGGTAETSLKKGNNLKVKVLGIEGRSLLVTRDGIGGTNARAIQESKRAARRQRDQALRSSMQGSSGGGGGNKGGKGKK